MNRREMMKGAALAGVVASFPITAAVARSSADRSAWDRAFAAYERATAEDEAFDRVFMPISDARREAIKALTVKPLPFDSYVGRHDPASEDGQWRQHWIARARGTVEEWDAGKVRVEDYIREKYEQHIAICREVVAIDDEYNAAVRQIEDRLGYRPAEERWEQLGELRWEAERRLLCDAPAPDAEALLFKLERLHSEERSLHDWEEVMADARRLLLSGRAA